MFEEELNARLQIGQGWHLKFQIRIWKNVRTVKI